MNRNLVFCCLALLALALVLSSTPTAQGPTPTPSVWLQGSSPGAAQGGNTNITGIAIAGSGTFGRLGGPVEGAYGKNAGGPEGALGTADHGAWGKKGTRMGYLGGDYGAYGTTGGQDAAEGWLGSPGVFGGSVGASGYSSGGFGVFGTSFAGTGVMGRSTTGRAVRGESEYNDGVYGYAHSLSARHGVHGKSDSGSESAAGVHGQGNGVAGDGAPNAAALRINNGAITVSGGVKPADKIFADLVWTCIYSWEELCPPGVVPPHGHAIGAYTDKFIYNPLIKTDSLIFLTVKGLPPEPGKSCYAQVLLQYAGYALVRVTVMGAPCQPGCSYFGIVEVNYLIINPIGGEGESTVSGKLAIGAPLKAGGKK